MGSHGRYRRAGLAATAATVAALALCAQAAAVFEFTKTDYAVTGGPTDLKLGDLDGANGTDILIATFAGGSPDSRVVRLLNQGGGAFGAAAATNSCNFGYDLLVHNFNPTQDSNLDAMVTCGTLLGDGSGGFATPSVPTGIPIQENLALAELTASGNPEVVWGGAGIGSTDVLCFSSWNSPNLGSYTCGNPPPFDAFQPRRFPRYSFADINTIALDNTPASDPPRDEIFTASLDGADRINVYGRDPSPGVNYNAWTDTTRTTSAGSVSAIAGGDLNRDGLEDVVVAHGLDAGPRFDTLLWDPGVGIPPSAQPIQTPSIMRPVQIAIADFDGDGSGDVAQANGIGEVAVHHGNGDGSFDSAEVFPLPGGNSDVQMAVGDLSGDGMPDIVVGERSGSGTTGSLSVLINGLSPPPGIQGLTGLKKKYKVKANGRVVLATAENPPIVSTKQTLTTSAGNQRAKKAKVIARGKTKVPDGQTKKVIAKVKRSGMKLLEDGTLRAKLKIVAESTAGAKDTEKRKVKLKAAG